MVGVLGLQNYCQLLHASAYLCTQDPSSPVMASHVVPTRQSMVQGPQGTGATDTDTMNSSNGQVEASSEQPCNAAVTGPGQTRSNETESATADLAPRAGLTRVSCLSVCLILC